MTLPIPRAYVVIVQLVIAGKDPWEETLSVMAYDLSEAVMTTSVRLTFMYGDNVKLRVKDIQPKLPDLESLIAMTMAEVGLKTRR